MLLSDDKMYQKNGDGTWSEAVPLPFYGLRKHCTGCGKKFWRERNYYRHYQQAHTNGIAYARRLRGLEVIDRRFQ